MDQPVTNKQIKRNVPKSKCLYYKDLKKIKNIDKLLARTPYIFILYQYKPTYGHWCLLILLKPTGKTKKRVLEFFDPYGGKPDSSLRDFPEKIRNRYDMEFPLVAKLMSESKHPLAYNQFPLQKHSPGVTTCGRWCILRCKYDDESVEQFAKHFRKKGISKDEIVVRLTQEMLRPRR